MLKLVEFMAKWFLALVVLSVIMVLPTMWIWNACIPDITRGALTPLSFWQALGLTLLCNALVKSNTSSSK